MPTASRAVTVAPYCSNTVRSSATILPSYGLEAIGRSIIESVLTHIDVRAVDFAPLYIPVPNDSSFANPFYGTELEPETKSPPAPAPPRRYTNTELTLEECVCVSITGDAQLEETADAPPSRYLFSQSLLLVPAPPQQRGLMQSPESSSTNHLSHNNRLPFNSLLSDDGYMRGHFLTADIHEFLKVFPYRILRETVVLLPLDVK